MLVALLAVLLAETPDLTGTWRLDEARSEIQDEAGLVGLIAAGVPKTLHVTHAKNGTLVVESGQNPSQARLYVPGRETTTSIFLGEAGRVTMTSRWEDGTLESEGVWEITARTPTERIQVEERYGLSDDGTTLEIEITTSSDARTLSSTLKYTRIESLGPCESWPSPCKTPQR